MPPARNAPETACGVGTETCVNGKWVGCNAPKPEPEANPPLDEILGTMNAVHEQALREIDQYTDEQLGEELPEPYSVEPTKLGSIYFASSHEMIHAGQIGLLRRLIGKPPVR